MRCLPHRRSRSLTGMLAAFAILAPSPGAADTGLGAPVVFVSRAILPDGSIYWDVPGGMPGVGPFSRTRSAGPGRLLVLEPDGALRTLVDGRAPSAATLHLVDVNAPAVSWDGEWIAFAGLRATRGGWRLYRIRADGTGLAPITTDDEDGLDLSRHGATASALAGYDDFDPVWLPDGRICFASTRWRGFAQYSGVRTSNLFVVAADGGGLHRITAERNGAERPLVDPLTGRIVFSRWWRNHRFPTNDMATVTAPVGPVYGYTGASYARHLGLTVDRDAPVGGPSMFRNAWQAASIDPDGSGLAMWTGVRRDEDANHVYGGAFAPDGTLFANYFPMANMTEAGGFGGIRRYVRGPHRHAPVVGITRFGTYVKAAPPQSFGIFVGEYWADPDVLPSGALVASRAPDVAQDYGLWRVGPDGSGAAPVLDLPGTAELRARVLAPRPLPPVRPGAARVASVLPPPAPGPYDGDGTFVFAALNVYANAAVDVDIVSAPPVGSANSIRFFLDHQRLSPGSFPNLDWPILLGEALVAADGSVFEPDAPAWLPLFEQLRTAPGDGYRVPLTGGPSPDGAAHVAGMNYGPPGAVARCVGCHAGHTMIPVPASDEEAKWSNLAPGASLRVSSARDVAQVRALVDRRARTGEVWRTWTSADGQPQDGQWVELLFPVPVRVRAVRLWNPRFGDEAGSTIQVHAATVALFADEAASAPLAAAPAAALSPDGTDVPFADVRARRVRVVLDDVSGRFYGMSVAALAEVEVIARGEGILAPEPGAGTLAAAALVALAACARRRGRGRDA